jgi:hypothetical protein
MISGPGERGLGFFLERSRLSICWMTVAASLGAMSAALVGGCQKEEGAARPVGTPDGGTVDVVTIRTDAGSGDRGADAMGKDLASDTADASAGKGDTGIDVPPIAERPADGGGGYKGAPYKDTPAAVPGTIQASAYDTGGEGTAYHDSDPGNTGARMAQVSDPNAPEANFRTGEDVDLRSIRAGTDRSDDGIALDPGKLYISWIQPREWVKYTIDVKQSGHYTIGGLVAAVDEGSRITFTLEDGTTTGPRALPWTHLSSVWHHADNLGGLDIIAGPHVLTMYFETANVNVEYLTLTKN